MNNSIRTSALKLCSSTQFYNSKLCNLNKFYHSCYRHPSKKTIHYSSLKITIDLKMAFTEAQITKLMDLLKIPEEKRNFEGFWDQIKIVNAVYLSKNDNTLEKILNSPGLQHIAENIFKMSEACFQGLVGNLS